MRSRTGIVSLLAGVALLAGIACDRNRPAADTSASATPDPRETPGTGGGGCGAVPSADGLRKLLIEAPSAGEAGGLFGGRRQWAAVVDRDGELCALVVSTDDPAASWPGSRNIAISKASTANAFSTDDKALSTARLYTLAQPGHTLWGIAAGNPFNPLCAGKPGDNGKMSGKVCGGTIVFGGGVALYKGKTKVGGLGTSGDTACADHEISKRIRDKAGLNPPDGPLADDITFSKADGPSVFTHPLCVNTWRNGVKLGDEAPAGGY